MKVPFSWLKEYVDIDITPQELEEKLFGCGFEVEELIDLSAEISRVVVGEITHIEKQEGTDHLNLCRIRQAKGQFIAVNPKLHRIAHGCQLHQGDLCSGNYAHVQKMLPQCTSTAYRGDPGTLADLQILHGHTTSHS